MRQGRGRRSLSLQASRNIEGDAVRLFDMAHHARQRRAFAPLLGHVDGQHQLQGGLGCQVADLQKHPSGVVARADTVEQQVVPGKQQRGEHDGTPITPHQDQCHRDKRAEMHFRHGAARQAVVQYHHAAQREC